MLFKAKSATEVLQSKLKSFERTYEDMTVSQKGYQSMIDKARSAMALTDKAKLLKFILNDYHYVVKNLQGWHSDFAKRISDMRKIHEDIIFAYANVQPNDKINHLNAALALSCELMSNNTFEQTDKLGVHIVHSLNDFVDSLYQA